MHPVTSPQTQSGPDRQGNPEVSIILVNWNALDYLEACLASIYANTSTTSFEIIVVDNASSEGDVDRLKRCFPEILTIKLAENLGFARANNLGFRHSSGKYVLLLNPDTKLVGPAIDTLMDRTRQLPEAGIVGCRQVNPDLSVQTASIQRFPRILNQVFNIEFLRVRWPNLPMWDLGPLFSDCTEPAKVEVIPGACMLMKREVFARVGGFTEDYFMYGEDIDLNVKVVRQGLVNYYIPDAVIIHYGGRSSSRQKVSHWATRRKYQAMGMFYLRNRGILYCSLYRAAMSLNAALRMLVLLVAYPVARLLGKQGYIASSLDKWTVILRWAIGMETEAKG